MKVSRYYKPLLKSSLVALLVLIMQVRSGMVSIAKADCQAKTIEFKELMSLAATVQQILLKSSITFVQLDDADATTDLDLALRSLVPPSPLILASMHGFSAPDRDTVLSLYEDRFGEQGVYVIYDSEFVEADKPKYNSILAAYRDASIKPNTTMILDRVSGETPDWPAIVQITDNIAPNAAALLTEASVLLALVPSIRRNKPFLAYTIELADDAGSDGSVGSRLIERRARMISCINPMK